MDTRISSILLGVCCSLVLLLALALVAGADDSYEENDEQGDAKEVYEDSYTNLWCEEDDEDWYKVRLDEGDDITATISFDGEAVDLDLGLYDKDGEELDLSETVDDEEKVTAQDVEYTGYYFIQVFSFDGEDYYDMDIVFEVIIPEGELNVAQIVFSFENDGMMNDVRFYAHIKDEEISGVEVVLYDRDSGEELDSGTTNGQGLWDVENLENGDYRWEAFSDSEKVDYGEFDIDTGAGGRNIQGFGAVADADEDDNYNDIGFSVFDPWWEGVEGDEIRVYYESNGSLAKQGLSDEDGEFVARDLDNEAFSFTIAHQGSIYNSGWCYVYETQEPAPDYEEWFESYSYQLVDTGGDGKPDTIEIIHDPNTAFEGEMDISIWVSIAVGGSGQGYNVYYTIEEDEEDSFMETYTAEETGYHDFELELNDDEGRDEDNFEIEDVFLYKEGEDRTIYVDDDGPADGDGTEDRPYRSIQVAVNEAYDGDKVRVLSGEYYGVKVNKTVTLEGSGPDKTTISGMSETVQLTAEGVTLTGFRIEATYASQDPTALLIRSDNNEIIGNEFHAETLGILLESVRGNSFRDNTLVSCGFVITGKDDKHWTSHSIDTSNKIDENSVRYFSGRSAPTIPSEVGQLILADCQNVLVEGLELDSGGVLVGYCESVRIRDCSVSDSRYGVYIEGSETVTVEDCELPGNSLSIMVLDSRELEILGNSWPGSKGSYFKDSQRLIIRDNVGTGNNYGIMCMDVGNSTIANNTFKESNNIGIYLTETDNNEILDNLCQDSQGRGISFSYTMDSLFSRNRCLDNAHEGLAVYGGNTRNTVSFNIVSGNKIDGIHVRGSEYNLIHSNEVTDNKNGIHVQDYCGTHQFLYNNVSGNERGLWVESVSGENNLFMYNNVFDNDEGAFIYRDENAGLILNWWGHESGPYNEESNSDGEGNAITTQRDFEPWLRYPFRNEAVRFTKAVFEGDPSALPVESEICLLFSVSMDTDSVEEALSTAFDFETRWESWEGVPASALYLIPKEHLSFSTNYGISMKGEVLDDAGRVMEDSNAVSFVSEALDVLVFSPDYGSEASGLLTITGNATPLAETVELEIDGEWLLVDSFDSGLDGEGARRSGDWSLELDTTELEDGTATFLVRSACGQQCSQERSLEITIDNNQGPQISDFELDGHFYEREETVTVTARVSDPNGFDDIELVMLVLLDKEGIERGSWQINLLSENLMESVLLSEDLVPGKYWLWLLVTDSAGENAEIGKDLVITRTWPEVVSFELNKLKFEEGESARYTIEIDEGDGIDKDVSIRLELQTREGEVLDSVDIYQGGSVSGRYKLAVDPGKYDLVVTMEYSSFTAEDSYHITVEEKKNFEIAGVNGYAVLGGSILVMVLAGAMVMMRTRQEQVERPRGKKGKLKQGKRALLLCPNCRRPARFIREYQRHWCDDCEEYVRPVRGRSGPRPRPRNLCPNCGEKGEYQEEYEDHYCWECEEYFEEM